MDDLTPADRTFIDDMIRQIRRKAWNDAIEAARLATSHAVPEAEYRVIGTLSHEILGRVSRALGALYVE